MTECKHGLDPSWCSSCKNPGAQRRESGPTIVAQYHGRCPDCGEEMIGQRITQVADEWVHAWHLE